MLFSGIDNYQVFSAEDGRTNFLQNY